MEDIYDADGYYAREARSIENKIVLRYIAPAARPISSFDPRPFFFAPLPSFATISAISFQRDAAGGVRRRAIYMLH